MSNDTTNPSASSSTVQDHRQKPRGVLPRQLQMWLMVGIAVVIILIILVTGHSQPAARPQAADRAAAPTSAVPDRIRAYQQQLADEEKRLQNVQAQAALATGQPASSAGPPSAQAADPVADDRRRREYQSLFADNIALSRRANAQQPTAEAGQRKAAPGPAAATSSADTLAALALLAQAQTANSLRAGTPPVGPAVAATAATPGKAADEKPREENPAPGPRLKLLEGTIIETVLLNRLDGTFSGPVECLVTTPVYSHDRQTVLIPSGARVLGSATPVQAWGDSRLAVSFHRLVMPDGHTYSLDVFKGLDQAGAMGLKDAVDRHYRQVFGASLAVGAISGLAQYGTRGVDANTFADAYRQSAGASLATSSSRVLDRYLNVLPTVTVREGFRIKVYLTNDFELPAYVPTGERP